jgi:polysaccharide biosynthesis protein PslH
MRAYSLECALARLGPVTTRVFPLAQPPREPQYIPCEQDLAHSWLSYSRSRELLQLVPELPERARHAAPAWGEKLLAELAGQHFDLIYVLRLYTATAALPALLAWPQALAVLDLDEDDAEVFQQLAALAQSTEDRNYHHHESRCWRAFADAVIPWFGRVVTSTDLESLRLTPQFPQQQPLTIPNIASTTINRGAPNSANVLTTSLLFVGNLDYPPNRDAVQRMVADILPLLCLGEETATLHIAGPGSSDLKRLYEGVSELHWHGYVNNLGPLYRAATIAIVPLRAGGGSRIKILEAMSYGVPVVATAKAVEGLNAEAGRHYLQAETNKEFVQRIEELRRDFPQRQALAINGLSLIKAQYSPDTVYAQLLKL